MTLQCTLGTVLYTGYMIVTQADMAATFVQLESRDGGKHIKQHHGRSAM